jgi:hypothetical protein
MVGHAGGYHKENPVRAITFLTGLDLGLHGLITDRNRRYLQAF